MPTNRPEREPAGSVAPTHPPTARTVMLGWALGLLGLACLGPMVATAAHAAGAMVVAASGAVVAPLPKKAASEAEPTWSTLTPAQRDALSPLARDWVGLSTFRKRKWLDLAGRMPAMTAPERQRIQERMAEWAQLSPEQRAQARMSFQEAKQVAPRSRSEQWDAYQALPPEQRRQLAARAEGPLVPASAPTVRGAASRAEPRLMHQDAKSSGTSKPKPVAPTVVQARQGATTNSMSRTASPPPYQQSGLPKISATPGFVDSTTLLPQRGPQGVATRSAAVASEPASVTVTP